MLNLFACHSSSNASVVVEPEKDYERVNFDVHRPSYSVKYLGCEELYKPGLSEICLTVKSIYSQKKRKVKSLDHYSLTLSKEELSLRDKDSTEDEEHVYGLRRILFCGVYKPKQTIFFYNYQFGPKGDQLKCHVVLCRDKEDAKSLAKVIGKAFREAQHEAHIEDVASRRLHAQGLSDSSIIRGESVSNIEANRRLYYELGFGSERMRLLSSGSTELGTGKSLAAKNKHYNKRESRSDSSHLNLSIECERTESSQDNANHSDTASTGHHECGGCGMKSSGTGGIATDFDSISYTCDIAGDTTFRPGDVSEDELVARQISESTSAEESYLTSAEGSDRTLVCGESSSNLLMEDVCDWAKVLELAETEL